MSLDINYLRLLPYLTETDEWIYNVLKEQRIFTLLLPSVEKEIISDPIENHESVLATCGTIKEGAID